MLILVRNERRMEYNNYEINVTDDYIQTLIDDVSAAFELEEGELELTKQDIANIWMDNIKEYAEDHILVIPREHKSFWSSSTYSETIFDYIHDYLEDNIRDREPWTCNSEVYSEENGIEER